MATVRCIYRRPLFLSHPRRDTLHSSVAEALRALRSEWPLAVAYSHDGTDLDVSPSVAMLPADVWPSKREAHNDPGTRIASLVLADGV